MTIKFKELKQYIARTIPVSICFRDGHYDNYTLISDIPEGWYDDLYVYGIGIMAVSKKDIPKEFQSVDYERIKGSRMATQMVIVLSKKPRTDVE